jgi:hypothetical protein
LPKLPKPPDDAAGAVPNEPKPPELAAAPLLLGALPKLPKADLDAADDAADGAVLDPNADFPPISNADFVAGDEAAGAAAPNSSDFCAAGATAAAGSFGFRPSAPPGDAPPAAADSLSPNFSVIGPSPL